MTSHDSQPAADLGDARPGAAFIASLDDAGPSPEEIASGELTCSPGEVCPNCHGSGKITVDERGWHWPCPVCGGTGRLSLSADAPVVVTRFLTGEASPVFSSDEPRPAPEATPNDPPDCTWRSGDTHCGCAKCRASADPASAAIELVEAIRRQLFRAPLSGNTNAKDAAHSAILAVHHAFHLGIEEYRAQKDARPPGEPLACLDCCLPYASPGWADFVVADVVWEAICPEPGVLCVTCMIKRAVQKGIQAEGSFTSGPFANHDWRKPVAPGEDVVERVARAMLVSTRPAAEPDKLVPRGGAGMQPVWRDYEDLARAALAAARPEGWREPFVPLELETAEEATTEWSAKILRCLAAQLGVGNDYFYPLIGLAGHLEREDAAPAAEGAAERDEIIRKLQGRICADSTAPHDVHLWALRFLEQRKSSPQMHLWSRPDHDALYKFDAEGAAGGPLEHLRKVVAAREVQLTEQIALSSKFCREMMEAQDKLRTAENAVEEIKSIRDGITDALEEAGHFHMSNKEGVAQICAELAKAEGAADDSEDGLGMTDSDWVLFGRDAWKARAQKAEAALAAGGPSLDEIRRVLEPLAREAGGGWHSDMDKLFIAAATLLSRLSQPAGDEAARIIGVVKATSDRVKTEGGPACCVRTMRHLRQDIAAGLNAEDIASPDYRKNGRPEPGDEAKASTAAERPAREMSDDELRAVLAHVEAAWDAFVAEMKADGEGHGGSPGEWMQERMDELVTEIGRRAPSTEARPAQEAGEVCQECNGKGWIDECGTPECDDPMCPYSHSAVCNRCNGTGRLPQPSTDEPRRAPEHIEPPIPQTVTILAPASEAIEEVEQAIADALKRNKHTTEDGTWTASSTTEIAKCAARAALAAARLEGWRAGVEWAAQHAETVAATMSHHAKELRDPHWEPIARVFKTHAKELRRMAAASPPPPAAQS